MDVAEPLFDISLALIVEKKVAQTARKHLEEHSYWDDTRRLTKLSDKHIAIPVTGQCVRTLLNTEGNGNVLFLQSSDDEKRSCREKAEQAESGARTNSRTLNEPPCSYDSPKKALPTSQNPLSREEAQQAESGSKSLLSTPPNDACKHLSPKYDHDQSATPFHKDLQPIWCGQILGFEAKLVQMDLPPSKKAQLTTPYDKLQAVIDGWVKEGRIQWKKELVKEIPKNWERHGDLILLPSSCFQDPVWSTLPELWSTVAATLNCRRVARRGRIKSDDFRSPRTEILLGTDSYVKHIDNGIQYTFDIRYSMFSSGNITEKLRIADLDCSQETVVDLYAGIGYFTLPYLVHAKAKMLYACEWNPHAVQALRKNLELNSVNNRCIVLEGDNREVCPKGVADRVNLGLIPSSEQGWPVACAALNPTTGGILHIHGNVSSYPNKEWTGPTTTANSQPDISSVNGNASECNDLDGRYSPTEQWTDPGSSGSLTNDLDDSYSPTEQQWTDPGSSGSLTKSNDSRLDDRLSNGSPCHKIDSASTAEPTSNEKSAVPTQLPPSCKSNISQSHSPCQGGVEPEEVQPSTIMPPNKATEHQQVTDAEDYAAMGVPMECSGGAAMSARGRTTLHQQQEPHNSEPTETRDLHSAESRNSQQIAAKGITLDPDTAEYTRKGKIGSILNAKPGNMGNAPPSSTKIPNVNGCQSEMRKSQPSNKLMYQKNLFNEKLSENCSELKRKAWVDWGCSTFERITQILCGLHGNRWRVELVHIEHVKSYAPHIDHLVVDLKCRPIT